MMREVLGRRFARLEKEDPDRSRGEWPDLLLIDGGKGQLCAVVETLECAGIHDVPVVGVSKGPDRNAGRETLHLPNGRDFQLPPNSSGPLLSPAPPRRSPPLRHRRPPPEAREEHDREPARRGSRHRPEPQARSAHAFRNGQGGAGGGARGSGKGAGNLEDDGTGHIRLFPPERVTCRRPSEGWDPRGRKARRSSPHGAPAFAGATEAVTLVCHAPPHPGDHLRGPAARRAWRDRPGADAGRRNPGRLCPRRPLAPASPDPPRRQPRPGRISRPNRGAARPAERRAGRQPRPFARRSPARGGDRMDDRARRHRSAGGPALSPPLRGAGRPARRDRGVAERPQLGAVAGPLRACSCSPSSASGSISANAPPPGATGDLAFVSPKSGRAVSAEPRPERIATGCSRCRRCCSAREPPTGPTSWPGFASPATSSPATSSSSARPEILAARDRLLDRLKRVVG